MPTDFRLHIDPADVLGVSRDATTQEIRDAYRAKAKRYHPDAGGEDWVFRVLVQSYEILSTARVALRDADRDAPFPPRPPDPAAPSASAWSQTRRPAQPTDRPFTTEPPRAHDRPRFDPHEAVRPGVHEPAADPAKVVDVEKVTIRFEADHFWLITDRTREDRFLSSSLNITWPGAGFTSPPASIPDADVTLRSLAEVFEALGAQTTVVSARSSLDDGRFSGWVSFPSDALAQAAFVKFRDLVHGVGLVVNQWSRELVIPKQWR